MSSCLIFVLCVCVEGGGWEVGRIPTAEDWLSMEVEHDVTKRLRHTASGAVLCVVTFPDSMSPTADVDCSVGREFAHEQRCSRWTFVSKRHPYIHDPMWGTNLNGVLWDTHSSSYLLHWRWSIADRESLKSMCDGNDKAENVYQQQITSESVCENVSF